MIFDFDHLPNRRGTGCYKYDLEPDLLPLWVADMDFAIAPCIQNALAKRIEHPVFGYNIVTKQWREAYTHFYKKRYGWSFEEDDLLFVTGVVPVLSSSVRALTEIGDEVVVMPPVYNIFYNSIRNSSRIIKEVPLLFDGERYHMDYEGLEKAFASNKTKLCFLCNPGNPSARIWSKEEMLRLAELAKKHNVIILSDEIHGPITRPGMMYVPFLSIGDIAKEVGFAAISPSKAFNLAGLQSAAIVVNNPQIKAKVDRQINTDEVAEPNSFALVSTIAALNEGEPWLDEMREYVFANRDFAYDFIKKNIPELKPIKGDATYLLWVDISNVEKDDGSFDQYLRKQEGVFFNAGHVYGKGGEGFIRINLATSREIVTKALLKLQEGVNSYGRK